MKREATAKTFQWWRVHWQRADQEYPVTRFCATQQEADQVAGLLRQDPAVRRVNVRRIR